MTTPRSPSSGGLSLQDARSQRKRRGPQRFSLVNPQQLHIILVLLLLLVGCILVEVLFIDTVFLGPGARISNVQLSNQDFFLADAGALPIVVRGKDAVSVDSVVQTSIKSRFVTNEYGEFNIVGLDTCRRYRNSLDEEDRPVMAVLGLFQRRIPFFSQLMQKNCRLPGDSGTSMIYHNNNVDDHFPLRRFPNVVLPVIVLQDPFPWMMDVCRDRPKELELDSRNCPALDAPVRLHYHIFQNSTTHTSLAHLWTEWHEPWLSRHGGPRLLIRAEDVVLHPQELVSSVCQCLGGTILDHFRNKPPWHIDNVPKRMNGYNGDLLLRAKNHLDLSLLQAMGYTET